MPINSAARIRTILEQVNNYGNHLPVVECWAKLLNITETSLNRGYFAVASRLSLINMELEIITSQMRESNHEESLYMPAINNIGNAISISLLNGQWSQVQQLLQNDTMVVLGFCVGILPNEEEQISQDDFNEIFELIQELRASIVDSTLPKRLIQLIEHHVFLIEQALAEYPISGAKALQEALYTAKGECSIFKDIIIENENASEITNLKKVLNKCCNIMETACTVDGAAQLTYKIFEFISSNV